MSRALLVLANETIRAKAVKWIAEAPKDTQVEFKGPRRSIEQNSLLWARLTEIAQRVVWHGEKLSPEDWKDVMTASLRKARLVPGLDPGSVVAIGMRTHDMSKEEFGLLLDLVDAFAAEHGVMFDEPA
jgi:hypothetical protein